MLILSLTSGVVILILSGLLIFFIRKNRKLYIRIGDLELASQQNDRLAELQSALQQKEKDMMMQALVVNDLRQTNQAIGERLAPFQYRFARKKDQEEYQQTLADIIRESARDPMEDFEMMFKHMHGGFFDRLLIDYPDLTRNELQVCALLRMNLTSKDMARLTNVTVSTVDITRHRIRKKLGLEPASSLTGHLIRY